MTELTLWFAIQFCAVCFVQNMAFTFVSRSRQSNNPSRHFVAAIFSNSIWFFINFFLIFPEVMKSLEYGDLEYRLIIAGMYTVSTALGSVFMMKINLGHIRVPFLTEQGKDRVGAYDETEKDE